MDLFAPVGEVRLASGREASVQRRHPWVYRGALASPLPSRLGPLLVRSASGEVLGTALPAASGGSLALRMVAFAPEPWNAAVLRRRLRHAWELRQRLVTETDAFRWIHAEGDFLPGLVADLYAGTVVLELYEPAWEPYLGLLVEVACQVAGSSTVLCRRSYRSGVEVLRGALPEKPVAVREHKWQLLADLVAGQKTGLFLDQRPNRLLLSQHASGARVLNLFAYTGGFAVAALAGGARQVVNVESSPTACELLRHTYRHNGRELREEELLAGDAFQLARRLVARGEKFDWVVVDPPAFVKAPKAESRGLEGYRDIALQALKLVREGGFLLSCSCSARVGVEQLEGALLAAALDAGREVRVLERRGAGVDHPVALTCPETRHLKVLWCAVR